MRTSTTTPTHQDIAARVQAAAREAGLSRQDLADRLQMPLPTMHRRMSGATPFKVTELAEVAQHLAVPVSALISGPEDVTTR